MVVPNDALTRSLDVGVLTVCSSGVGVLHGQDAIVCSNGGTEKFRGIIAVTGLYKSGVIGEGHTSHLHHVGRIRHQAQLSSHNVALIIDEFERILRSGIQHNRVKGELLVRGTVAEVHRVGASCQHVTSCILNPQRNIGRLRAISATFHNRNRSQLGRCRKTKLAQRRLEASDTAAVIIASSQSSGFISNRAARNRYIASLSSSGHISEGGVRHLNVAVGNTERTGRITGSCSRSTIGFDAVGNRTILSDGGLNAALDEAVGERGVLNDDGTTHLVIVIGHIVTAGALGSQLEAFARNVGKLDIAGKVDDLGAVDIHVVLRFIELEVTTAIDDGVGHLSTVDEGDIARGTRDDGIIHRGIIHRDTTADSGVYILDNGTIVHGEVTAGIHGDVLLIVVDDGGFAGKSQVAGSINSGAIVHNDVEEGDIALAISRGSRGHRTTDVTVVQTDIAIGRDNLAINLGIALTLLGGGEHVACGLKLGICIYSESTAGRHITGHSGIRIGESEGVHRHIAANDSVDCVKGHVALVFHENAVHGNSSLITGLSSATLDGQTTLTGNSTQINLLAGSSGVVDIQLRELIELGSIGGDIELLQVHLAGITQLVAVNLHFAGHNGGNTLHATFRSIGSNNGVVELDGISGQCSVTFKNSYGSGGTGSSKDKLTGIRLGYPATGRLRVLNITQRAVRIEFIPLTVGRLGDFGRLAGIRPVTGKLVCCVCITTQRRSRLSELLRAEIRVVIRICVVHAGANSDNSRNEAGTQFNRQM